MIVLPKVGKRVRMSSHATANLPTCHAPPAMERRSLASSGVARNYKGITIELGAPRTGMVVVHMGKRNA